MKRLLLVVTALALAPLACIYTSTRPPLPTGETETSTPAEPGDETGSALVDPAATGTAAASAPTAVATAEPTGPPACATAPPKFKPPKIAIKLVDPGAEPRKALRYRPRKGYQSRMSYDLFTKMHAVQGGKTVQKAGVGFVLTIGARVVESTEDKSRFDFKVTKLKVPDVKDVPKEFTAGVRKELSAWKNVSGFVEINSRGLTENVDIKGTGKGAMAAGRANDIRVALEQTPNPFPEEPIGVGAKWEVATVVDTGLTLRGTQTFELISLKGNKGKVKFTIDQRSDATPGPAICPQAGVVVQPTGWTATGEGEREFDLSKLLSGMYGTKLKVVNESAIWVQGQRQTQTVNIDMTTKMTAR